MAFLDLFGNQPAQTQQFSRLNPSQANAQNQILSMGLNGLQNLNQSFDFSPIERQARTQFQTNTIPSIAERFTAMGSGPGSSNFIGRLGAAGAGLEQSLASLRSNLGLQQQGQQQNFLSNLLSLGLQPQTDTLHSPEQPGFLQSAGVPILQGLGQALPYLLPLLLGGATGGASTVASGALTGLPLLIKYLQSSLRGS